MKVCKFGGTSMADAAAITMSAHIMERDPERRYAVVSAPGKRFPGDEKVTDLLYKAHAEMRETGESDALSKVFKRFSEIAEGLSLDLDLEPHFETIKRDMLSGENEDYTASRGEYLAALVFAKKLSFEFIDATEIVKFFDDGTFDAKYTDDLVRARLEGVRHAVIPGFYGLMGGSRIRTFSRGGSDISGAIIAGGVEAELYENWTDVNGFLICDPRIVEKPEQIPALTYKELRELSYMGASVLHHDAIFPVRKKDIPINIKNTFAPEHPGTMIIPTSRRKPSRRTVTGIAGRKNFLAIHIEKSMMNSEIGFLRRALTVFEHHGISIEHLPTGIDTITFIVERSAVGDKLEMILEEMKVQVAPDIMNAVENLSLIATVGHGMSSKKGTAAKLFAALSKADVNISMIDQGSSELNIIVGVRDADFEKAINAIYGAFFPR